jgi:hypothetical protein
LISPSNQDKIKHVFSGRYTYYVYDIYVTTEKKYPAKVGDEWWGGGGGCETLSEREAGKGKEVPCLHLYPWIYPEVGKLACGYV